MQKLIVDGYNVVHADSRLSRLARSDLEAARRELIRRLSRYLESKNVLLTVVFDGHGGITDVEVEIPGRLQVMYSPSEQTADELILEILEAAANPREYVVVTSDMADIGRSARSIGASILKSPEFLARIEPRGPKRRNDRSGVTEDDVDYWIRRFGASDDPDHGE